MLQKIKNRLKDQAGLTLIELLAVIVILGIIAAIAVPSIMNVINNSKEDAIKSDAIQVLNAAKLYVASENVTGTTFTGTQLQPYVDGINTTTIDTVNIIAKNELTLTGSISNGDKTLTLLNSGLPEIQKATFEGDTGTAAPFASRTE